MSRRDIGTDDPRVHVRPGKRSRPRTKIRPDYSTAARGRVTAIDRGRYCLHLLTAPTNSSSGTNMAATTDGAHSGTHAAATAPQLGTSGAAPTNSPGTAVTASKDRINSTTPTPPHGTAVTAVKARELPRGSIAVGDVCAVVGDLSGRPGTLARITAIDPRSTVLRRTAEDGDSAGNERVIVANADQMLIVCALAQPEPKTGFIDRCLVAAYEGGLEPILVLTKADLASAQPLIEQYQPLGLHILVTAMASRPEERSKQPKQGGTPEAHELSSGLENSRSLSTGALNSPENDGLDSGNGDLLGLENNGLGKVRRALDGHVSVLVGQSGVGKSTLINALVPEAARATGEVNAVTGKGRHTSTSAVAFTLEESSESAATATIVIDTPGIRGFGLAHVSPDSLLNGFADLAEIAHDCPRGCTHQASELECALSEVKDPRLQARTTSYRRLLSSLNKPEWA